jgi:lipoate-protein ligase A
MAMDEALLDLAIDRNFRDPIVRIYRWSTSALSIGRHQRLSDPAKRRCEVCGVEVVRRPTGGAAVLHGSDVTYSVSAPTLGRSVLEAYRWVAHGLIAGLERLGVVASISQHDSGSIASPACFASTRGADLEIAGSKICGSAQVRRRGWFLQQGSIPLQDPWPLTRALLDQAGPSPNRCLHQIRSETTYEELEGCLIQGFTSLWGACRETNGSLPELIPASSGRDYTCLTL